MLNLACYNSNTPITKKSLPELSLYKPTIWLQLLPGGNPTPDLQAGWDSLSSTAGASFNVPSTTGPTRNPSLRVERLLAGPQAFRQGLW